jgi:uncharacterized protein YcbK (DUF882 family)
MYDPTQEKIAGLDPYMQYLAIELVNSAREAGIPLMVISGRRSLDYNRQVGGAPNSKHLSGRAIDVQVAGYTREQLPMSWWQAVGQWAQRNLGLRWGGYFNPPDVNHFDV